MFLDVGYVDRSVGSHCLIADSTLEPLVELLAHHGQLDADGSCLDLETGSTRCLIGGGGGGDQCSHAHCDVLLSSKLCHIL